MDFVSLDVLVENQSGIIEKIGGNFGLKRRLMEMGFIKGEKITVVKYAPLRDPVEYKIKDYHLSLRKNEAKNILVEKIED